MQAERSSQRPQMELAASVSRQRISRHLINNNNENTSK